MTAPHDDATTDLQSTIATLRRQLDERGAERDAALARETALAEVVVVINRSPGDLSPVFSAILENAMRLCEAAFGLFCTLDGERLRAVAQRGVPEAYAQHRASAPSSLASDGIAAQAARTRRPVHVLDMRDRERYRAGFPDARAIVDLGGARSTLLAPLVKEDTFLGYISVYRQEVRAFTDEQIGLLENFAAQAVIAMENARLIAEQRDALEQRTATADVLQVINASPGDLVPVFDAILEKAHRVCGATIGALMMFDGEYFHAAATRGFPEEHAALVRKPFRPSIYRQPLLRGERLLHFPDMKELEVDPDHDITRSVVDNAGVRTALAVPLRKDGTLRGYISAFRLEVRPFSEKEIALLENFAAQAVIAMENARLLTEQREALEQQTATAEVLQVINANPGNLAPVFDAILEKAHSLCGAPMGSLMIYDGTYFRAVATHGFPEQHAALIRLPFLPLSHTGALVAGERFVHVADIREGPARSDHDVARSTRDASNMRTALYVPLRKDGVLLGCISASRPEVRAFSQKEVALLENFAAQAVIAMENARLLTEQREALEQQTATAEVLQVINANPGNLAPVFDTMLEKAIRLCEAEFGILRTWDEERFHLVAAHGDPRLIEWARGRGSFRPDDDDDSPLGRIVRGEQIVHSADALAEAAYHTSAGFRAMVDAIGFRSGVTLALRKDAALLGVVTVYRKGEVRPFTEKQIALLQNFATQGVIAMENARLLGEIRQRQDELRITFENMGDGVALFDETPRLVAWNRKFQELLDVPDEILAERLTYADYIRYLTERGEYGPNADGETQLRRFQERMGEHYALERTRPDGRVIEVRHNPVPDGGFVLIYADITERKRNEAEIRGARDAAEEASRTVEVAYRDLKAAQANLIQAEKMASLGQLTAGIAHEIKNPLNFVNNFASLSVDLLSELKEAAAPGFAALDADRRADIEDLADTLTSNLQKINEHGQRADGIVRSMLEHSRGTSGERRMVDLNTLAEEALNLAYHGARAQDQSFAITLERDFQAGISPIELTPQDMTRVLLNLFSNGFYAATKRARSGTTPNYVPTLKIATRALDGSVEIRVRDNGTGVPADIRDKLFQPFFTTKPTGEGTGLGLSIMYDIVTKQHGGAITVESEPNSFTEFTIAIPRIAATVRA